MTDGFNRIRHFGFNGISKELRAARRRHLRAIQRILNSHGWKTINRHLEYVGKGAAGRRLSRVTSSMS